VVEGKKQRKQSGHTLKGPERGGDGHVEIQKISTTSTDSLSRKGGSTRYMGVRTKWKKGLEHTSKRKTILKAERKRRKGKSEINTPARIQRTEAISSVERVGERDLQTITSAHKGWAQVRRERRTDLNVGGDVPPSLPGHVHEPGRGV